MLFYLVHTGLHPVVTKAISKLLLSCNSAGLESRMTNLWEIMDLPYIQLIPATSQSVLFLLSNKYSKYFSELIKK